MKQLFLLMLCWVMSLGMINGQAAIDGKVMDKEMDEAIDQLTDLLKDFSFDSFFDQEITSKFEEIKPKDKDMKEAKDMMIEGLDLIKSFDFSVLEDVFREVEKSMDKIEFKDNSRDPSSFTEGKKKKPAKKI